MSSTQFRIIVGLIALITTAGATAIAGISIFQGLAAVAFILSVDMTARLMFMSLVMAQMEDKLGTTDRKTDEDV